MVQHVWHSSKMLSTYFHLKNLCDNMEVDFGVLLYFFRSVDYVVTEELFLRYSFSYLFDVFISSWLFAFDD